MAEVRQASPHFECHFVLWPLHVRQAEEVGIKPTLKMLKLGFMYSKIAQDLFFPGNMWVFFSCTTLSVRAVQASLDLTSLRNEKILTKTGSSAVLAVIETMQLGSEHECPIKRSIPSRQRSEFTKRGGGGAGKERNIRKRRKPVGNRNNLSNSQGNNQLFGLEAVPQESAQY